MNCRHCGSSLQHVFLDLGYAPPSNSYLIPEDLQKPEKTYPLKVYVCAVCWLVQTEDYADAGDLFNSDYAYFSSVSSSWLDHARNYSDMIVHKLKLNRDSFVVEVAANDGYLLKNFVAKNIPCLGIEPTAGTAAVAESRGIPIRREFFGAALGSQLAREGRRADLIIGNNVYAHVPRINDFTVGLKVALKPGGTITLEFPHLMRLIEQAQFDTVYHEHFSYLSLYTVNRIFEKAGLKVFDVEHLPTHGGSVRVYGCHAEDPRIPTPAVAAAIQREQTQGLQQLDIYQTFQRRADTIKNELLAFLLEQKRKGKTVAAYGAAAKGNTLLNYAGVKPDLLPFVCDAAVSKQGKYMPGSHIPILAPSAMAERKPDWVLILPWNLKTEIMHQLHHVHEWGGQFIVAVPALTALS